MRTAEPRYTDDQGWIGSKLDSWFNNDEEFVDYSMDEVREQYRAVREREDGDFSRYLKDAMLHVAAVSYDAALEGEITVDEFDEVLESTRDHVVNHYFEDDQDLSEPVIPELERSTQQFSRQGTTGRQYAMEQLAEGGQNGELQEWYEHQTDGTTPDRVIGVPGGGIEAGIIASEALDVELDLVRASPRKRGDEEAQDVRDRDYTGLNILAVDDIQKMGRAEKAITEYAEENRAGNVVLDAGIPEWDFIRNSGDTFF